jgi:hypothetical protein
MIGKIYRAVLPSKLRAFIYNAFLGKLVFLLRNFSTHLKSKFIYAFGSFLPKTEYNEAMRFIGKNGITSYPYPYRLKYEHIPVLVELDELKGLRYVLHNGRKLYFPTNYSDEKVVVLYRSLLTEQDENCAHRYVKSYEELKGMTLLDIGSAEGIFALDTIELTEKVYLFECEKFWIQALNATFEPWAHKVEIIEKYVGDQVKGIYTTIDSFLDGKNNNHVFLKMDIEGAEKPALKGCVNTLKNGKGVRCAVTTYHRPEDPEEIDAFFKALGYQTEFTKGMLFWGKRLSKALIRAEKVV